MSARFRPYASAKHHVTKGRYITSNDPRGYIPVYEYPLNGQWIMMDIDDGYILWTGIWKALGNSKADIAKMIESQPNLAPLIRRVRGGYLKIQGTWMPYEVALRLSRRVAWAIRDELVPLFGPNFPSTCLSPDQPGFGQVVPSGQVRRRRKSAQNTIMQISSSANPAWTVVSSAASSTHVPPFPEKPQWHINQPDYAYPPNQPLTTEIAGGYTSPRAAHPPSAYHHGGRAISSTKIGLSLDTCSIYSESVRLPPIHSPVDSSPNSPYTLPPISAMEALKGQDSAAVLRRLRMDDDEHSRSYSSTERRPYVSSSSPRSSDSSTRFQPYARPSSRSHSPYLASRSPSMSTNYHRSFTSTKYDSGGLIPSDDDDSASNPSPPPPITPTSENEGRTYLHYHHHHSSLDGNAFKKRLDSFDHTGRFGIDTHPTQTRQKYYSDDAESIPSSHRPW